MVKFFIIVCMLSVHYIYAQKNDCINQTDSVICKIVGFQPPDKLAIFQLGEYIGDLKTLQPILSDYINNLFETCNLTPVRIIIQISVLSDKTISGIELIRGVNEDIDKEIIKIVELLECIEPAYIRDRAVNNKELLLLFPQDKEAVIMKMLKDFYTKHTAIWSASPPLSADIFNYKVDSIIAEYCTNEMRKKAEKFLEYGFDIMTDDRGMDLESLNTLKVKKDSAESNIYIVSYIVDSFPVSPDKPVKRQVHLRVGVVEQTDGYKINGVTE